jgi:hypothetical protein
MCTTHACAHSYDAHAHTRTLNECRTSLGSGGIGGGVSADGRGSAADDADRGVDDVDDEDLGSCGGSSGVDISSCLLLCHAGDVPLGPQIARIDDGCSCQRACYIGATCWRYATD